MTTFVCLDPVVGERALEAARGPRPKLPADARAHMRECESCRVAAERGKRIARVWNELAPTAAETAAAHARFVLQKRRARVVPLRLALATAAVLVGAVAFAGAGQRLVSRMLFAPKVVAVGVDEVKLRAAGGGTKRAPASALASNEPMAVEPPVAPSAVPAPAAPIETESVPAAPVPPRRTSLVAREATAVGDGHRAVAPLSSASAPVTPAPSASATPSKPWIEAAAALRTGDYATAERAFNELAASSDPRTRDEARLARAQVWIAQHRSYKARAELGSLATSGATELVRQRAADALRAMDSSPEP